MIDLRWDTPRLTLRQKAVALGWYLAVWALVVAIEQAERWQR